MYTVGGAETLSESHVAAGRLTSFGERMSAERCCDQSALSSAGHVTAAAAAAACW